LVDFSQFLRWFLPLSAVALSACAGAQERPEPHPQLPDIGFHYDLRASQSGDLQVILSIRAPILPEILRVAFPDRVAGRTGLFEAISAIDARDENGEPLGLIVEDGSAYIGCGDARVVHVHYQVAPPDRELTHSSRFRAIGSDSRFFSFGHAVIAQPLDLNPELDRAVQVTTHTEDGNWQIQATIPLDEPYPITALVDAGFFAGEFEHVRRVRGGRSVDLWVEETIANQPQTLADLALAVVEAQAHLLGDDAEHTRVIALRRADDEHARTGSGRAGGFVLELGDAVDARTDGLAELIAHENFHRLNGHTLRFASREELATMWFREGVTDYVAMRNAADNGVIAESAFFRYLGRSIAAYLTNPARGVPMAEFEHRFWTNRDLQRFPYDHGSIAALLIDLELRRSGEDIEAFFTFLRTDGSVRVLPLTNSAIRDALERFSRSSWTAFFDAYIVGGQPFEVFESLNAVGLEVVERVEPAAYYGFRTSVTVDGTWFVSSVDSGSPSAQAGVFPGMELRSDPYVPMHAIDGVARLEEVTNRGWRTIEVRALRGQRRAFALTAEGEEYRAAFGFHGE
jgi:predicted metalloprotease with PDZ domain